MRAAVTFDVGAEGAWGLFLDSGRASVTADPPRDPDLLIRTSAGVLTDILLSRRPGYDAFLTGELEVRGNLALGLELESLFLPPGEPDPSYPQTIHPKIGRMRWSVLAAGPPEATPVLLLHGLGSSKMSMLPLVEQLGGYRVFALDLPGFGDSAKPLAPYDAPWFAQRVLELMDALEVKEAVLAGNSMGARISLELALNEPERVKALALFCPPLGIQWFRRAAPLIRLARAELAVLPLAPSRGRVLRTLRGLFAQPDRVPAQWLDMAADEFFRVYAKPRGRMAFYSAARSIYLDEAHGEQGLWARLSDLKAPVHFVFGDRDPLVPASLAAPVAEALPQAQVSVFADCGHVPQIEQADRTGRLVRALLS